jgi:hypothetical protein
LVKKSRMMYLRHMRRGLLGRNPGDGLPAAAPVEIRENPSKTVVRGGFSTISACLTIFKHSLARVLTSDPVDIFSSRFRCPNPLCASRF